MPAEDEAPTTPVTLHLDLERDAGQGAQGIKELTAELLHPTTRLSVAVRGGSLGRAEAVVGKHNWAAAHYWTEPAADLAATDQSSTVIFEFSEALPAGLVRLRLPYRRGPVA